MSNLIAICSDSHDNIPNIDKFLNYCKTHNINIIIHCGDITTQQTKQYFINNFSGKIHFIEGNADIPNPTKISKPIKKTNRFQKIKRSPVPFSELEINNTKIAFCHKKDKAERLANKSLYEIIYYGHTHKPWEEKINNCLLLNPGTLAGMFMPPTFAILDTSIKKHKLILLNEL